MVKNTDAKGEGTTCMVNNGANPSDNQSGRNLQDGSTERVQNTRINWESAKLTKRVIPVEQLRYDGEAEINVSIIEFLCLNNQLVEVS